MIAQAISDIRRQLPPTTQLVAVSKFHPVEEIMQAYDAGQRIFGESHVQELVNKASQLPDDIQWHFIGHLQTNKVKQLLPHVALIHAVDTSHLLAEINKHSQRIGRSTPCLMEIHIAQEETKYGFTPEEAEAFLAEGTWRQMTGVTLAGIMCMASNVDDEQQIRDEFRRASTLFHRLRETYMTSEAEHAAFCQLSMGMSSDWHIAIAEGATLVRIGTTIFGERVKA